MESSPALSFNCTESDQFQKFMAFLTSVPQLQSYMKMNPCSTDFETNPNERDQCAELIPTTSNVNLLEVLRHKWITNQTTPPCKMEQSAYSPSKPYSSNDSQTHDTTSFHTKRFRYDSTWDDQSPTKSGSSPQPVSTGTGRTGRDDILRPNGKNPKLSKRRLTDLALISQTVQPQPQQAPAGQVFRPPVPVSSMGISTSTASGQPNAKWPKLGVPLPASPTRYSAPVHIDVGGTLYTSSLKVLTKYPDSRLGKMFNGSIPIVLDTMKQHYFIDRDGKLFRHILNFLRTGKVYLDFGFDELDQLIDEVYYYGLEEMEKELNKSKESNLSNQRRTRIYDPNWDHEQKSNHHIEQISRVGVENRLASLTNITAVSTTDTSNNHDNDNVPNYGIVHKRFNNSKDTLTIWQSPYIWFELDNQEPWSGSIIYSTKFQSINPMANIMEPIKTYLVNHCSATYDLNRFADSYWLHELRWIHLERIHILKLWQLFSDLKFELLIKYDMVTEQKTKRFVHILKFLQMES